MEKGSSMDFQETSLLKRMVVGISGKLPRGFIGSVDLDVSAVFFSKAGEILGSVDSETNELYGVAHSGNGVAGQSVGDDEAIMIDLTQIPPEVAQIFLLLTVKGGDSFKQVESAYARVADQACTELVRYEILGGAIETGLIIARIFRSTDKRWSLQALGMFCHAESWQDATGIMEQLFTETPEKVQASKGGEALPTSRRFSGIDPADTERAAGGAGNGAAAVLAQRSGSQQRSGSSVFTASSQSELGMCKRLSSRSRCITAIGSEGSNRSRSGIATVAEEELDMGRTFSRRRTVRKGTIRLTSMDNDDRAKAEEQGSSTAVSHTGGAATAMADASGASGGGSAGAARAPRPFAALVGGGRPPNFFQPDLLDADMVPVDDQDRVLAARGPGPVKAGLCTGSGCWWVSRMQFLSACVAPSK